MHENDESIPMKEINILTSDLTQLMEWLSTGFEIMPQKVKIVTIETGIGTTIRAEVDTSETEGRYKDLTNYENW